MIRTILAAGLMLAASSASAATADDAEDMRCLIVAAELAEDSDSEVAEAGTIMTMYFLGRIDGRSPGANLEQLLVQEAVEMSEADKERLLIACSAQLELRGKQMEALGSSLG